jgi:hypothetical protein
MRHSEPEPATCGGMGKGRFVPRPSHLSSLRRPASSFSAIGGERKLHSSSEDSAKKREPKMLPRERSGDPGMPPRERSGEL